jgi:hypothetical protein
MKETNDIAWFSTIGFISMGFAFNIATALFIVLGNWSIKISNSAYILIGIPWVVIFILLFFNARLKKIIFNKSNSTINQYWRLWFWIYYIITGIVYICSLNFYNLVLHTN